jgi:Arc/MetJ family transcription regulator
MKETLRLIGLKTKREAIELGLRAIVANANSKGSAGFAASSCGR